ncbi:MAG: glycosyltransferase family 2 protein [bacterium]|nr:glycosyltransferase family 2 protein [bacterium]
MKLSVIIPCFNEEENVRRFAPELLPVLDVLGMDSEVVLVDDGSADGTAREIKNIHDARVRLVAHEKNQGLSAAMRTGIAGATGDLIVFLDSDLTFHPKLIPALLSALEANDVDFVIGSPKLGGYAKDIPAYRLFVSKMANLVYATLLGKPVTSINQILRLYKTPQLKELHLTSKGYEINAEILFKLVFKGRTFVEIPAELTARQFGVSKLNYAREFRRHAVLLLKIIWWKFFSRSS